MESAILCIMFVMGIGGLIHDITVLWFNQEVHGS